MRWGIKLWNNYMRVTMKWWRFVCSTLRRNYHQPWSIKRKLEITRWLHLWTFLRMNFCTILCFLPMQERKIFELLWYLDGFCHYYEDNLILEVFLLERRRFVLLITAQSLHKITLRNESKKKNMLTMINILHWTSGTKFHWNPKSISSRHETIFHRNKKTNEPMFYLK